MFAEHPLHVEFVNAQGRGGDDSGCRSNPLRLSGQAPLAQEIARAEAGQKKYGTMLRVHNGRDPLWDAYQEALDLSMYLRQAILERDRNHLEPVPDEDCNP